MAKGLPIVRFVWLIVRQTLEDLNDFLTVIYDDNVSINHCRSCCDLVMIWHDIEQTLTSIGRLFVLEMKPHTSFCHYAQHFPISDSLVLILGSISTSRLRHILSLMSVVT